MNFFLLRPFASSHPPLSILHNVLIFAMQSRKKSDCERICLKRRNFHCWCWCVGESLSRLQPLSESSFVGCHHKNEKRGAEDERKKKWILRDAQMLITWEPEQQNKKMGKRMTMTTTSAACLSCLLVEKMLIWKLVGRSTFCDNPRSCCSF